MNPSEDYGEALEEGAKEVQGRIHKGRKGGKKSKRHSKRKGRRKGGR